MKPIQIDRRHVVADPGGKFTLLDPDGHRWYGDCRAVDYGPKDYYEVYGVVTEGPAEWIGLSVRLFGHYHGQKLLLELKEVPSHLAKPQDSPIMTGLMYPDGFGPVVFD